MWRSQEENKKLEADTNKMTRNIALFVIVGSAVMNMVICLVFSIVKGAGNRSIQDSIGIKTILLLAGISIGGSVLYAMWIANDYRKAMKLFKGSPNEPIGTEEEFKANKRISALSLLVIFLPWFAWMSLSLLHII